MLKRIKNLLEDNAYIIAISLTLLIAYLSLSKPIQIEIPLDISFLDKILHATAYFTLTISWLFALRNYSKNKLIVLVIFFYGVLMEFLQGWLTETRQKDIFDVYANSFGILLAMLIFNNLFKYFIKIFDK
jgi:VanZ family protein